MKLKEGRLPTGQEKKYYSVYRLMPSPSFLTLQSVPSCCARILKYFNALEFISHVLCLLDNDYIINNQRKKEKEGILLRDRTSLE